jgi:hypothetical protein
MSEPSSGGPESTEVLSDSQPVVLPGFEDGIPEVPLEESAIFAMAMEETQLSDFGDESFKMPFRVLLKSLVDEADMHAMGRLMMFRTLVRLLSNRLKIHDDLKRHPEILDVPIRRPLFILGFPRTGTTFLHKLLACDPNARSMSLWEGLYPSPPPEKDTYASDPRIEVVREWIDAINKISPQLASAHKLDATGPEECLWLFEHTFADLIFELRVHVPSYSKWLLENENKIDSYRYFRSILQLLTWRCGGQHWVLKAPRHLFGLEGLLAVFPDAKIIQTHRDPAEVLPSLCSLTQFSRLMYSDRFDAQAVGAHWLDRLRGVFTYAMRLRQTHEQEERKCAKQGSTASSVGSQFLDIHYRDLIADPIAIVQQIYAHHDYPYSDAFEANMKRWLTENRQHKHGKHQYSLDNFGLDAAKVDRGFEIYRSRFNLNA